MSNFPSAQKNLTTLTSSLEFDRDYPFDILNWEEDIIVRGEGWGDGGEFELPYDSLFTDGEDQDLQNALMNDEVIPCPVFEVIPDEDYNRLYPELKCYENMPPKGYIKATLLGGEEVEEYDLDEEDEEFLQQLNKEGHMVTDIFFEEIAGLILLAKRNCSSAARRMIHIPLATREKLTTYLHRKRSKQTLARRKVPNSSPYRIFRPPLPKNEGMHLRTRRVEFSLKKARSLTKRAINHKQFMNSFNNFMKLLKTTSQQERILKNVSLLDEFMKSGHNQGEAPNLMQGKGPSIDFKPDPLLVEIVDLHGNILGVEETKDLLEALDESIKKDEQPIEFTIDLPPSFFE